MTYYLMHKDIKVLKMSIDKNAEIKSVLEVYEPEHMPFSTKPRKNDYSNFKLWWKERSIPLSRNEYSNLTAALPNENPLSLVVKAHGLSLTDQYWIKKEDENVVYDDISFFSNKFTYNIGDFLVGKRNNSKVNMFYSPDSTSTGNLNKRWKIIDGKKFLLKAGTKPHQYEIFNEIICSSIMEYLHIKHVNYDFYKEDEDIYCLSEDFILYNEDFVSAYQLARSKHIKNDESFFDYLMKVYEENNIPNFRTEINKMLFVDFLVGNSDRHLNNFGVIRDAKTLKFLGISPVFDTGSCFGFDLSDDHLIELEDVDWKPFKNNKNVNQLTLIDDFSWLEKSTLKGVVAMAIITMNHYPEYLSKSRKDAIIGFLVKRVNEVYKYLGINDSVSYHPNKFTLLEKKVISYMKENQELYDIDKLANTFNVSYITLYRTISSLTNSNVLKRMGSRKRGYWIINEDY